MTIWFCASLRPRENMLLMAARRLNQAVYTPNQSCQPLLDHRHAAVRPLAARKRQSLVKTRDPPHPLDRPDQLDSPPPPCLAFHCGRLSSPRLQRNCGFRHPSSCPAPRSLRPRLCFSRRCRLSPCGPGRGTPGRPGDCLTRSAPPAPSRPSPSPHGRPPLGRPKPC